MPPTSFGSQIIGGGARSSGAYRTPDISSAWSAKGSGGRRGGASGLVRAARSVAVRSSNVSVSVLQGEPCKHGVQVKIRKLWGLPSGTGPLISDGDGVTASVRDIISKTDANEPRARVILAVLTRLVFSSSATSRCLIGWALCSNVLSESCVIGDRDERPGSLVRQLQKLSTTRTTRKAAPTRMPPSTHRLRLRKTSPRTRGWKARIEPRRRSSQIWRRPPVCECVLP